MTTTTVFPVYEGLTREVLLDWAMHNSRADRRARIVGYVLAWHYDADFFGASLSHTQIKEHLASAYTTVREWLDLLIESGEWLAVERYQASGAKAPQLYVPLFPHGLPEGVSIRGYATTEVTEAGTVIRLLPTEATQAVQVGGE